MSDHRPHPKLRWHNEAVVRPQIFVVPGDSTANSSVVPRGKTWGIRTRGDTGGVVAHEYRCPVHGVFTALVSRASVPDEVACQRIESLVVGYAGMRPHIDALYQDHVCDLPSPWAGSSVAIGIEPGMVTG